MARITKSELQAVFQTDAGNETLDAMIEMANIMVTQSLSGVTSPVTLSAAELKMIEKMLAAHFLSLYDPRETRMEIGDGVAWYEGQEAFDMGLKRTSYGQQALIMDRTGTLARQGMRRATWRVVPKDTGVPND